VFVAGEHTTTTDEVRDGVFDGDGLAGRADPLGDDHHRQAVAHAIRTVTLITLHEGDVGEERYPAVRDLLVKAVAAGLTTAND
jgi:hypothetical protein